jgi:hypothetical protein
MRTGICCTKRPAMLFVISRKIGDVPGAISALQSGYVDIWDKAKSNEISKPEKFTMDYFKALYHRLTAKKLQSIGLALFGVTVLSKFLNEKKKMYKYAPEFLNTRPIRSECNV